MTAAGWAIWHDKNWGSTARIMHWSSWECKHKSMLHAYGGQYCMLLQCFRVIVYSIHLYKVSKCHLFINLFKLNSILGGTECPKPGSQKKISWAKTRYIHNYIVYKNVYNTTKLYCIKKTTDVQVNFNKFLLVSIKVKREICFCFHFWLGKLENLLCSVQTGAFYGEHFKKQGPSCMIFDR